MTSLAINVHDLFVLSPDTLAVLHRLIAILLALVDALTAHVDGAHRPLLSRLAARACAAYLKRLAADLTAMKGNIATDPAPQPQSEPTPKSKPHPKPARTRRIRIRHTPSAPRLIRLPSPPPPETSPLQAKITRLSSRSQHVQFITISK